MWRSRSDRTEERHDPDGDDQHQTISSFICGRRLPGLENIIKERLTNTTSIGFGSDPKDKYDKDPNLLSRVTNQDLREFGMNPEFLGRLPVTVTLQGLTKDFLVRILKEPKNAILKQYKKLLAMDEVNLDFDDERSGMDCRAGVKERYRSQSTPGDHRGVHA